jgi:integrase
MHARLAAAGLAKPREGGRATLGAFIDAYIASRPDVKPHTLLNMKQVRHWLVEHFGEGRDLRTITPGDAEAWLAFMRKGGLGENTIRRHVGRARQLFKSAIRRGLIRGANPFDGMSATVRADKARLFFVTRDMAAKVLEACPDAQWKLLFALSRYGGLRCPSEHLALKWSDVDWERNRIRVPSPKTEHHEGKESRIIPLFPELRPYLLEVFDEAEPGTEHVITRYRDSACNLRTQFGRIFRKAGLEVWPKPWHNLRATRQTELAERYPIHVVCQWIGNSRAVAQEHYLQVTDAHFAHAVAEPLNEQASASSAAQNQAQYPAESTRTERETVGAGTQNHSDFPGDSEAYDSVQNSEYPRQDSNL